MRLRPKWPVAVATSSLFFIGQAHAATLSVGPTQPYPTIQSALAVAGDGDVIEVDPGVYQGPIAVQNTNIIIEGLAGPEFTFVTSSAGTTVTTDQDGLTLRGLDLANSTGGVVVDFQHFNATLEDVRIANATSSAVVHLSHFLWIYDSTFENNTSATNGGAIRSDTSLITIDNSHFIGNTSSGSGGAIYIDNNYGSTNLVVTNSVFTDNQAAGSGGAAYAPAGSVTSSVFRY